MAKQLNEVYFYVSHVRQSQNTEHAKVISLTNRSPDLTTENHLIKIFH